MLGICFMILSVLGIMLLILLALMAAIVLLVLFCPFRYSVRGMKNESRLSLTIKVSWLAGFLRIGCNYPDPGNIKARVLCFTVFNRSIFSEKDSEKDGDGSAAKGKSPKKTGKKKSGNKRKKKEKKAGEKPERKITEKPGEEESQRTDFAKEPDSNKTAGSDPGLPEGQESPTDQNTAGQEQDTSLTGRISSKIEKLRYTFRSIYDKIKKIWKNISYYIGFLQEEETKLLLSGSVKALGKILKSIRPRRIKADILFGTGSPDTTGYIYGIYCMFSAGWGSGFVMAPDFDEAVFEGEFDVSGRITLWVMLVNGLKMYQLIRKLKTAKPGNV